MPPSPRSLGASAALLAVSHRQPLARLVAGLVRAIARESWHDLRLTCACVSSCVRRYAADRAVCRWSGVRSVGAWSRCCCAPVSVSLVGRARDFSRRVCQHCRLLWVPNASIHSLVTSLSFRHADATRKGANSARDRPRVRGAAPQSTVTSRSKSVTHTTYDTVRPLTRPEAGSPVAKAAAHPPDACAAPSGGAAAV